MRTPNRNWLGRGHAHPLVRTLTPVVVRVLPSRRTLCSDIYLSGRWPLDR
ncbi:hypothetical protein AB0C04_23590 [Micromonospora sp. NPDC048909]